MKEYIEKENALMQLTGINLPEDTCSYIGIVDRRIYNLPPANVVERSMIDKAIAEIEKLSNRNYSYWATCDVVDREDVLEILRNIGE